MKKLFDYKDVRLIPDKCIVDSRKECDTSVKFGDKTFEMPIYPANMKSVVNYDTCKFLAEKGYFYTMHRFDIDVLDFIRHMDGFLLPTSISVGINKDSYETLQQIYHEPLTVNYITIDVANAWSDKTCNMIQFIKSKFPETFLIVGNVATSEAVKDLEHWGADAIKIGIGPGSVCITYLKTGVGTHGYQLSCVRDCAKNATVPIIADGGIVEHGDIAKALSFGATMVMAGSLFAGYDESAGSIIELGIDMYKEYFGSASKHNKNEQKNIEGKKTLIRYRGPMDRLLRELKEDLQSSISYVGGKNLEDLKKAKHVRV
jgi:GMP reductase